MTAAPRIVLVSGLSGSGKSTVMSALEDQSFYCVDNLPVQLVDQFLDLCRKLTPPIDRIAMAIDAREGPFLAELPGVLAGLRARGAEVETIFLDCADEALQKRYRETRRVHPLAPSGGVQEGIEAERKLLAEVVALADHVIDTSDLNVHELRADVLQRLAGETRATLVRIVSFGFRYTVPPTVELLFDVRFLPNPHFEEHLRAGSGNDPEVARYVLENDRGPELLARLVELLRFLLPLYDAEGKAYLTVGVGCTGGRHRSVAISNALAAELERWGREVKVEHRDVERSG